MKHPKTLSIGGATYDLFIRTGEDFTATHDGRSMLALPLGEKIRIESVIETCGGGACNTAVGLGRLGCQASFSGMVGSDQWGEKLLASMQREGVQTETATVVEKEMTSFSLILSVPGGERVILYEPGTNAHLDDATFDRERAAIVDWIYLNHIHERTCMIEDDLLTLLSSPASPKLTWNPGGSQIKDGIHHRQHRHLLSRTALLLVNKSEALAFTGQETLEAAMRALLETGAQSVCITDGARGVTASDGKKLFHCPVLPVTVVDTTGAGDAFGVGATWALLSGFDLSTALQAGTMNSASVLRAVGAQAGLLTDIEMRARLTGITMPLDVRPLP